MHRQAWTVFDWLSIIKKSDVFVNKTEILPNCNRVCTSCLSFWDEVWLFLSLRLFGLLSSLLLLFSKRFGRYVLRPSTGVFRTRWPLRNLELRPLLIPRVVACYDSVSHNRVQVIVTRLQLGLNLQMIVLGNQHLQPLRHVSCWAIQNKFLKPINLMFLLD